VFPADDAGMEKGRWFFGAPIGIIWAMDNPANPPEPKPF
jgi:hypothetical protein